MLIRILVAAAVVAVSAAAQAELLFNPLVSPTKTTRLLALPGGGTLMLGASNGSAAIWGIGEPGVAATARFYGKGKDVISDAAIGPDGHIWIVGSTTSDDFPLVNPIVAQKAPYAMTGFVELDENAATVLFSTFIGGQGTCLSDCSTYASAVAVDASGNVYVGGSTDEADFRPLATPLSGVRPRTDSFNNQVYVSWLVKISASRHTSAYSVFLGTGDGECRGGSSCITHQGTKAAVDAVAVNGAGSVTVAESMRIGPGRVSRLAADGASLLWSTRLTAAEGGAKQLSLAMTITGETLAFGAFAPLQVPTTTPFKTGTPGLFLSRLNSTGGIASRTDLGSASDASPAGILLDSSGRAWLAGTSSAASPLLSGGAGVGSDFILRLEPEGTAVQTLIRMPRGVVNAPPVVDTQRRMWIAGANGALLSLPDGFSPSTPMIFGFANSASFEWNTGISPGALVTILGLGMAAQPGQVLIGGRPAPLLYSSANQINLQVPFEALQHLSRGQLSIDVPMSAGTASLSVLPERSIGIFSTDGTHVAAINQDGSVNSSSRPYIPGTIVSVYGTGAAWSAGLVTGGIASDAAPLDQGFNGLQIVDANGIPGTILYAGAAPQIINGVFQLNFRMAASARQPFTLQSIAAGGNILTSNPIQLW